MLVFAVAHQFHLHQTTFPIIWTHHQTRFPLFKKFPMNCQLLISLCILTSQKTPKYIHGKWKKFFLVASFSFISGINLYFNYISAFHFSQEKREFLVQNANRNKREKSNMNYSQNGKNLNLNLNFLLQKSGIWWDVYEIFIMNTAFGAFCFYSFNTF